MKNCDTLCMYHSLNERLIEEYLTVERNKSGVLGLPMSSLFSISQQMYHGLNQECVQQPLPPPQLCCIE